MSRGVLLGLAISLLLVLVVTTVWAVREGKSGVRAAYVRNVWTALNRISVLRNERVPMRDGVMLSADVYLPRRFPGPHPVVYVQTPYDKTDYFGGLHAVRLFANEGYAIVVQDVRGRYDSEGEFDLYSHAVEDGRDTLDWIMEQFWASGSVGTFGCSALGEIQYLLANSHHPNHRAMIVESGGGAIGSAANRYGFFGLYEGGVFNLASGVGWFSQSGSKTRYEESGSISPELLRHLPILEIVEKSGAPPTDYEEFVSHDPGDPWWDSQPYLSEARGFGVPGLHVNGWYDLAVEDTITLATGEGLPEAAPQNVIISPSAHCGAEAIEPLDTVGELPVARGDRPYGDEFVAWFDHWLKGEGEIKLAPLELFVLGANEWIELDNWPPRSADFQAWYLDGGVRTGGRAAAGVLSRDEADKGTETFQYDPRNPVLTRGGPHCCTGNPEDLPGSFDQHASAARDDVLVYDSAPLDQSMRVVGPVRARLLVSTSAADTDFTAKLVDVWPDGRAFNVQDGVFRLRYRNGFRNAAPAVAGKAYEIEIGLRAVAYEFAEGHRLRLEISSSNFPRLARNLNTGGPNHLEKEPIVASNTVHYGGKSGSRLILPMWLTPDE